MGSVSPGEWGAPWRPTLGIGCPGVSGAQGWKTALFPEPAVHSEVAHIHCGKSLEEEDVEALTLGYST